MDCGLALFGAGCTRARRREIMVREHSSNGERNKKTELHRFSIVAQRSIDIPVYKFFINFLRVHVHSFLPPTIIVRSATPPARCRRV